MVLPYWFMYIFGKKTSKSTFTLWKLKMITSFTLMNSFICFFLKTYSLCWFYKPRGEKWLIHKKSLVAAPAFLVLNVSLAFLVSYDWPHDISNREVEEIIRWSDTVQKYKQYICSNIFASGPIFTKLTNDFYLNIYHLALVSDFRQENIFSNRTYEI